MGRLIASWSGGKDSTASIILCRHLEQQGVKDVHIDEIVFAEVMYDLKRGISAEAPDHIEFMRSAIPIFESWGYPVRVLRADTDYLSLFMRKQVRPRLRPEHAGMCRGFPLKACWARRDLKVRVIEKFNKSLEPDAVSLVGICADEPRRLESMYRDPHRRSILAEQGITQAMAMQICEEHGLLSPIYRRLGNKRTGCWLCPFAKPAEQALVPPEVWEEFCALEKLPNVASPRWQPFRNGETLAERNQLVEQLRRQLNR